MGRKSSGLNYRGSGGFWRQDDRTGFSIRAWNTEKEWTGLLVDQKVWEIRQPQDFVRGVKDDQTVNNPRPLSQPIWDGPLYYTLAQTALVGASEIILNSIAGLQVGDVIGVILDNGSVYTVQILTLSNGNTVGLVRNLPSQASQGNQVVLSNIPAPPRDDTPDIFGFEPVNNARLNREYVSNEVIITGIDNGTPISGGPYSINGGPFTTLDGTINGFDSLNVKVTSSSIGITETSVSVTVGTMTEEFTVTTRGSTYFTDDVATFPWYNATLYPVTKYSDVNLVVATYEASHPVGPTGIRQTELCTLDYSTGNWTPKIVLGDSGIQEDDHGVPMQFRVNNWIYSIFGSHGTTGEAKLFVTTAQNEPCNWTELTPINTSSIVGLTYPHFEYIGSTGYLFFRDSNTTAWSLCEWKATFSTPKVVQIPTWDVGGARIIITGGINTRVYPGNFIQVGTDIHFVFTIADLATAQRGDVYYAVRDTAANVIRNFENTFSVASASWPVGLADLNANFRIMDVNTAGGERSGNCPVFCFDTNGHPCVINTKGIVSVDGFHYSPPGKIYLIKNTGTASVPGTWVTTDTGIQVRGMFDGFTVWANAGGGLGIAYINDPTLAFLYGGNQYTATMDGAGVWGSSVLIRQAGTYAFNAPVAIQNGDSTHRFGYGETQGYNNPPDPPNGTLKAYLSGDTNPVIFIEPELDEGSCTFFGAGTITQGNNIGLIAALPDDTEAGQLCVSIFMARDRTGTITIPEGFEHIDGSPFIASVAALQFAICTKSLTGDDVDPVFGWSSAASNPTTLAVSIVLDNPNPIVPVATVGTQYDPVNASTIIGPISGMNALAGQFAMVLGGFTDDYTTATYAPGGELTPWERIFTAASTFGGDMSFMATGATFYDDKTPIADKTLVVSGTNSGRGGIMVLFDKAPIFPNNFDFPDLTDVPFATELTSATIRILGINTTLNGTVVGGTYSKNGGDFSSSPFTVSNGDTFAVKGMSPSSFGATSSVYLIIDGEIATFSMSVASSADDTPFPYSFTDQDLVAANTVIMSNIQTISGMNVPSNISVTGGISYSINGSAYTSAAGTINSGDTLQLQITSSSLYETAVSGTVSIGGTYGTAVTDTWGVTTRALWSLVGFTTGSFTSSGNFAFSESSITGIQDGDLMVAAIAYRDNAPFTNAVGFSNAATPQTSGNTAENNTAITSGLLSYRIRSGTPDLTFTRVGGSTARGVLAVYRRDSGTPTLDVSSANTLAVQSGTVTTPGFTTTANSCLIVAMGGNGRNSTMSAYVAATDPNGSSIISTNPPTNGQWILRAQQGTSTGIDCRVGFADAVRATNGATGTMQFTQGSGDRGVMMGAAFK